MTRNVLPQQFPLTASHPPSPVGEFPDLTGAISRLRLLASPCASLAAPTPQCSLRDSVADPPPSPTPRCLDDPCLDAPLSDPGGPPAPGHYKTGDVVFRTGYYVNSAMILISGLNHAACTLPVYASRPRSPQDAQHSVPAGGQPRPGRTLACSVAQKVSVMSIPLHACPRACPRASESGMPSSGGILLHQALPGAQTRRLQLCVSLKRANKIAYIVLKVAERGPFRAVCLPRAMAAQWMLHRRGIANRLLFGVRRDATGSGLEYHAWLTVAGECLVGMGETMTWAPLQPFGGNDTTAEIADGSGR